MSIAASLLGPRPIASAPKPRRRGRPPVAADPDQRQLHTTVAKARLLYGKSVADVCTIFDVSPRTVAYWTKLALGYEGPIADALRRAAERN